jgi:DNA-binding PadR family transcriptional regulator
VQERSLNAFLDLAILCTLVDKAMTGYEINRFLTKKFGIIIGPNTIYSKLTTIERKGWTKSVQNRAGRAYCLTERGREITDNINSIAEETRSFIKILLGC